MEKCPARNCDFSAENRSLLVAHYRDVHGGRLLCEYSLCSVSSKTASDLRKHVKVKHEGVVYTCDGCGKEFITPGNLNRHMIQSCKRAVDRVDDVVVPPPPKIVVLSDVVVTPAPVVDVATVDLCALLPELKDASTQTERKFSPSFFNFKLFV